MEVRKNIVCSLSPKCLKHKFNFLVLPEVNLEIIISLAEEKALYYLEKKINNNHIFEILFLLKSPEVRENNFISFRFNFSYYFDTTQGKFTLGSSKNTRTKIPCILLV